MSLPFKIERKIHVYGAELWVQRGAVRGLGYRRQAENQLLCLCIYFLNTVIGFSTFNDRLIKVFLVYFEKAASYFLCDFNPLRTQLDFSGV